MILRGERNIKEYIDLFVETLYVVVWRSIDLHLSSKPWVGLCLDLLRAKSEGLVPMEIPLGLIPRTPYDERRVGVA